MGFQRDVLGADPATAWQLDVFGHDPQFPGIAADAGLTSSSWARGPHHQWGPMAGGGDPRRMQFSSEFEWIAPSGRGLLTHYMPAHYGAGWGMDSTPTLEEAEAATFAAVRDAENGSADPQRAAARRHRLHATEQVGDRDPPRLECALRLAEIRLRATARVLRRGAFGARRAVGAAVAANPGHEPDLHRQGRVIHRHQTGQPGGRERGAGRGAIRGVRQPAGRCDVPAGRAGEGLGAAGVRRPSRRHHRLGVRPGVPRPADRLARRLGARRRGTRTTRWRCCQVWSTGRLWCGTNWRTTEPTSLPRDWANLSGVECECSTPTASRCPRWSSTTGVRSAGWRATCRRWAGARTG